MNEWPQNLWPVHVKPKTGELLSSWIVRLAQSHGMKVQSFCQQAFGREHAIWNRDIDKLAPRPFLEVLCEVTGASWDQVWQTTLNSYEGVLYEHHNPFGNTRWILPLGVYHRTRKGFGLLYCPLCLKEDREPYFRKQWRLAFHVICDRHGTMMLDRCPACSAAVVFFRREMGKRKAFDGGDITRCHACGADLRNGPAYDPPAPDGQVLSMLRSLITFHDMGWWFAGTDGSMYSHLFFDVLHHVSVLLASKPADRLRAEVERRTSFSVPVEAAMRRMNLEERSFYQRYWQIVSALWLLQDWPDRFIGTCEAVEMSMAWVMRDWETPWWFERAVRARLDRTRYVPGTDEVESVVRYLRKRGEKVSSASIGRLLGGRDHWAAAPYKAVSSSSWPRTEEGFDRLIGKIDEQMRSFKAGSVRRLLAERDRLAVLMMKAFGWSAQRVLGATVSEVKCALLETKALDSHELKKALCKYLRETRPKLISLEEKKVLLVGWKRGGIGAEGLAQRCRKLFSLEESQATEVSTYLATP